MKNTGAILLIFVFFSCSPEKEPEEDVFYINPETFQEKEIMLSEIAASIDYIPLESTHPIQHIMNIISVDSFLFVSNFPDGLHLYSKTGAFLTKIGKRGNGPGEYQFGTSFTVDNKNKLVYILDKNNIYKYNFQNQFLGNIAIKNLNGNFRDIEFYSDHLFLFETVNNGYANYKWVEVDTLGKVISIQPNSNPQFECKIGFRSDCSYKIANSLIYWDKYNDTIFQIKDQKIIPRYLWDNWENKLPRANITPGQYENFYFDPWSIIESKDFLFIFYHENQNYNTAFLDKKERQFYVVNKSTDENDRYNGPGFTNDIDGGLNFAPMEYYSSSEGEYLTGWNFATKLTEHLHSSIFKNADPKHAEKKKELEQLANSLDENDNPVLMLVKLK